MKIMIVDDNQEMRKFLRTLLERADVEFIECDDGSEAIAQFAEALPDWTLMDVRMSQVDGLSADARHRWAISTEPHRHHHAGY